MILSQILEDKVVNVVEDAFKVANGLQERAIKSDMDGDGERLLLIVRANNH
jgi:hypothetical protein